jgi:nicotinate dehydrogenase subunit B
LNIPAEQLVARDGAVIARTDASKRVTYGELIAGAKFGTALNTNASRKPPNEWTILGTPVPRIEIPAMVTAQFEYVHNVRVPGMLHGQVVRPPSVGASVERVDEASVKGMAGIVKVVVKKDFVGVVAEKPWQAVQAPSQGH